jgi:hypothetical protein
MLRSATLLAALLTSTTALAQTAAPPSHNPMAQYKFEVTPFVGYRTGGKFEDKDGSTNFKLGESESLGFMVNVAANASGQYEFLYAHQSTEVDSGGLFVGDPKFDLDVEYYQFGGTYLFDGDVAQPFIALTFGMSRFDPQPAEFSAENFFSASFGGGIQLNPRGRFGVRLEGRVYTSLIDDNSRIFCGSDGGVGGCLIEIDGTLLTQWEARAGIVFRF